MYGKYLAATLAYLAARQHDAVGLIVFDDKIREHRPRVDARPADCSGVLHAIDRAQPGTGTDLKIPFERFREVEKGRGLVAVISDFYCDPDALLKSVQPLAYQGQDVILFQLLDPQELKPRAQGVGAARGHGERADDGGVADLHELAVSRADRRARRRAAQVGAASRRRPSAREHHRAARRGAAQLPPVPTAAGLRRMSLLAPAFLLGLLAIGLPLWLHRLSSDNPNKQKFSSLMFLEPGEPRRVLAKKVQYLLLLALRIGVLVLLALAFAQPAIWRTPQAAATPTARACT